MFCPKCGAQISDGAKFCPSCGGEVKGAASGEAPAKPGKAGAAKPRRTVLIAALAVAIVVVIGVGAAFALGAFGPKGFEGTVSLDFYNRSGEQYPYMAPAITLGNGTASVSDASGEVASGSTEVVSDSDGEVAYRLSDVQGEYESYGSNARVSIVAPKEATADDLTGRWGYSIVAADSLDGSVNSVRYSSYMLDLNGDGSFDFTESDGRSDDFERTLTFADVSSSGWEHGSGPGFYFTGSGTWERQDDGSYLLSMTQGDHAGWTMVFAAS